MVDASNPGKDARTALNKAAKAAKTKAAAKDAKTQTKKVVTCITVNCKGEPTYKCGGSLCNGAMMCHVCAKGCGAEVIDEAGGSGQQPILCKYCKMNMQPSHNTFNNSGFELIADILKLRELRAKAATMGEGEDAGQVQDGVDVMEISASGVEVLVCHACNEKHYIKAFRFGVCHECKYPVQVCCWCLGTKAPLCGRCGHTTLTETRGETCTDSWSKALLAPYAIKACDLCNEPVSDNSKMQWTDLVKAFVCTQCDVMLQGTEMNKRTGKQNPGATNERVAMIAKANKAYKDAEVCRCFLCRMYKDKSDIRGMGDAHSYQDYNCKKCLAEPADIGRCGACYDWKLRTEMQVLECEDVTCGLLVPLCLRCVGDMIFSPCPGCMGPLTIGKLVPDSLTGLFQTFPQHNAGQSSKVTTSESEGKEVWKPCQMCDGPFNGDDNDVKEYEKFCVCMNCVTTAFLYSTCRAQSSTAQERKEDMETIKAVVQEAREEVEQESAEEVASSPGSHKSGSEWASYEKMKEKCFKKDSKPHTEPIDVDDSGVSPEAPRKENAACDESTQEMRAQVMPSAFNQIIPVRPPYWLPSQPWGKQDMQGNLMVFCKKCLIRVEWCPPGSCEACPECGYVQRQDDILEFVTRKERGDLGKLSVKIVGEQRDAEGRGVFTEAMELVMKKESEEKECGTEQSLKTWKMSGWWQTWQMHRFNINPTAARPTCEQKMQVLRKLLSQADETIQRLEGIITCYEHKERRHIEKEFCEGSDKQYFYDISRGNVFGHKRNCTTCGTECALGYLQAGERKSSWWCEDCGSHVATHVQEIVETKTRMDEMMTQAKEAAT